MSAESRHRAWISGWGIPPQNFQAEVEKHWPHDRHTVFAPTARAIAEMRALQPDFIGGYSLGALLVLSEAWAEGGPELICLAPILAFDAEAAMGGRTPTRSRVALQEKFRKNPGAAVKLYLRLAGLADQATESLPYAEADLAWGLDQLAVLKARPETIAQIRLWAGRNDPLIDPEQLQRHCPQLRTLEQCDHDFRTLLPRIAPLSTFPSHA